MPEHRVSVDQLLVGMYIHLDLKWMEHPFFFSSFKIKNVEQIETIKALGLEAVRFDPERSSILQAPVQDETVTEGKPLPPVAEPDKAGDALRRLKHERIARMQERNRRIQKCEKEYVQSLTQVKNVMQNLMTGSEEALEAAGEMIGGMVESLLSDREVVVHLMNVKGKDEGVFYHTLNVAILALLLGKECGIEAERLQYLGIGALFHDIGKSRIPKGVLYKQGRLTPAEQRLFELHPRYGEEIVSRIPGFPVEASRIILQHHETEDGKGYPHQLNGPQISDLAKITSIANVYDNHCNHIKPEDSLTPHEALAFMFRRQQSNFDKEMLTTFIRSLGVYPPGTVVLLSNELFGLVISINLRNPLRPGVLIYDPDVPPHQAITFEMEDEPELSISKSIRPSQLLPEVYQYLNPRARIGYFIESSQTLFQGAGK